MISTMYRASALLAVISSCSYAQEVAFGDIDAEGHASTSLLDNPVPMALGLESFFLDDPMLAHNWLQPSIAAKTMHAETKSQNPAKVARLEAALKEIFTAMPKNAGGRLDRATARYAMHRYFSSKYGWTIKGIQPAGAAWTKEMRVTPDVKSMSKYVLPAHLQDLLGHHLHQEDVDLKALVTLVATIEHLIDSETLMTLYDVLVALKLPVSGRRSDDEVNDIVDTFLLVHAFGLNLEVSVLQDVKKAKAHLEKSHPGWHELQAVARDARRSAGLAGDLDFKQIVQVVKKVEEGYMQFQRKDCSRVKKELIAKPSHTQGRVQFSEVQPSHSSGRRSLLTEGKDKLEGLGVLNNGTEFIIANYVNSQSMCLSTASFYSSCCENECEGLLARLEREVAAPDADPAHLARLMPTITDSGIAEPLLSEISGLAGEDGRVPLHGSALAAWMHRAFPLECPAPQTENTARTTNPRTPNEWRTESDINVHTLPVLVMMEQLSQGLSRYVTMGSQRPAVPPQKDLCHCDLSGMNCKCGKMKVGNTAVSTEDLSADIRSIMIQEKQHETAPRRRFVATLFQLAAVCSLMGTAFVAVKSIFSATAGSNGKVAKEYGLC
jgi:hypothetical protein